MPRAEHYNLPVFLLLFICCVLFMYVYLRYYKKLLKVFSSVLSYSASQQLQREGYSFFSSFSTSLFLIYMICGSFFYTELTTYMGWFKNMPVVLITLLSVLVIGILVLIKKLIGYVLGLILKEKNAIEDCFFQYTFSIYTSGLAMLVLCLLLYYSNLPSVYLFYIGIGFLLVLFVLRTIKIFVFGHLQYGFSIFHLVLYLCAVEIIPLVIFVKTILKV